MIYFVSLVAISVNYLTRDKSFVTVKALEAFLLSYSNKVKRYSFFTQIITVINA